MLVVVPMYFLPSVRIHVVIYLRSVSFTLSLPHLRAVSFTSHSVPGATSDSQQCVRWPPQDKLRDKTRSRQCPPSSSNHQMTDNPSKTEQPRCPCPSSPSLWPSASPSAPCNESVYGGSVFSKKEIFPIWEVHYFTSPISEKFVNWYVQYPCKFRLG
jgi:hypothetical protein